MVQISSMMELTRMCQSHIVTGLCYGLFFLMIWSLDLKHKKKRRICRRKVKRMHLQKVYEHMDNMCGQKMESMDGHGNNKDTITRH